MVGVAQNGSAHHAASSVAQVIQENTRQQVLCERRCCSACLTPCDSPRHDIQQRTLEQYLNPVHIVFVDVLNWSSSCSVASEFCARVTDYTLDIGLQPSVPLQTQILIHSISSHQHLDERLCFHVFPCIGWVLPYLLFSIAFYRHLSVSLCWSPDWLRQMILMVTVLTGSTICQGCGGSRFVSNKVPQAFIPAQRSWMPLSFPTDTQRLPQCCCAFSL